MTAALHPVDDPGGAGATARPAVVLSLNAGAASLKAAVRDPGRRLSLEITGLDGERARVVVTGGGPVVEHALLPGGWPAAVQEVAAVLDRHGLRPDVVAHRVAHGSAVLRTARPATPPLLARLREEARADPLQLPRQLAVLDAAAACWPGAGSVLVPDTVFHTALPTAATLLPLPPDARAQGLRRWGLHGLAVQSVVDLLPGLGDAVVVHLGHACSVTAVSGGMPRATTAAVSPAGGVVSLTGSGDLDPEVVLRLVEVHGGSVAEVRQLLQRRSGVAGISGGRTDVAALLSAGDAAADLAVQVLVRSVAMAVAAAVTTLDRWEGLVFTGGLGAGSPELRERVCARLLPLRPGAAGLPGPPSEQLAGSGLEVLAVPVDEEAVLDRLARAVGPAPGPRSGGRPSDRRSPAADR